MYFGVSLKVRRNGLVRDIADDDARLGEGFHVGFELAQVTREDRHALAREQTAHADEQFCMVALDVPIPRPHLAGIGERGRVNEDEIPALLAVALFLNPGEHVGANELLVPVEQAVELHIAHGPLLVGVGDVHRRGELCLAGRRVDTC